MSNDHKFIIYKNFIYLEEEREEPPQNLSRNDGKSEHQKERLFNFHYNLQFRSPILSLLLI